MQLGIRAVLGTSFTGIFADNAANNGLLLVILSIEEIATLGDRASDPSRNQLTVDLAAQTISGDGILISFATDPLRRNALMRGLDAIGSTLQRAADIRAFQAAHLSANPWLA